MKLFTPTSVLSSSSILYISYDGILEPLGQSQVLAYSRDLSKNFSIHLVGFEKADDWKNSSERICIFQDIGNSENIWHPLCYQKSLCIGNCIVYVLWKRARFMAINKPSIADNTCPKLCAFGHGASN
jgi:hypothetical protein